jgi:hypothetical protein
VVRGPAAVLGLCAATLAYLLAAPLLPDLHGSDLAHALPGGLAIALLAACALLVVPIVDATGVLLIVLPGAFLLVAGLAVADVGAAASLPEALLFGLAGAGFVAVLDSAALALVLPLFVAIVDAITVIGGGHSGLLTVPPAGGDPLTLELPGWGDAAAAGQLGIVDVVFLAIFAAYARRHGLREGLAGLAMTCGLALAFVLEVLWGSTLPALPFLSAGYVLPNVNLLPGLFRRAGEG